MACGDNNAFTNNDYTDFYITLPKDNVRRTALWLSDRMEGLDITPETRNRKRVMMRSSASATSTNPTATSRCCCGRWPTKVHLPLGHHRADAEHIA